MELCEDSERESYKYRETLYDSLKICYDATKTLLVFWNKYQIFIHENQNYKDPAKILVPEFQINQVLVGNNNLICVDTNGNVHTISLKFKNSAQKRLKSSFQPREKGVLRCVQLASDAAVALKHEFDGYFLCWHKINMEFQLEKKVVLITDIKHWPIRKCGQDECILSITKVGRESIDCLKSIFKDNVFMGRDYYLILISFDKLTVYAGLLDHKNPEDTIDMVKLYSSATEISDIKVLEDCVIIMALSCGTLVKLSLKDKAKSADIVHLNTALAKIEVIENDKIIYTDGLTMWKAEKFLSKGEILFDQLFVKDVKDFVKIGDHVICTTFANVIYKCLLDEDYCSKKDINHYCPVDQIINNSEYLYNILKEVEKNKEIIEMIDKEGNYLTAVTLSSKQELMKQVIYEEVNVYEKYQDVVKENPKVILLEDLEHYFEPEALLFLIKIKIFTIQHNLGNILTEILKNVTIHLTFMTFTNTILKTASIKTNENFKEIQLSMSLPCENITKCKVEVKLVSNVPGALDQKSEICTVLHKNVIELNVEHYIKTDTDREVLNLKQNKTNIQELIKQVGENHHGELFEIKDFVKLKNHDLKLNYFVKLPDNFKEFFSTIDNYDKRLGNRKVGFLHNNMANEDFLSSKKPVFLGIGTDKVELEIQKDDFCSPLLKISCRNMVIALDMRNFFAKFFYKDYEDCRPGEIFVSNALYTTTENLQRAPETCESPEEYMMLLEKFHKNVIGNLPL